MQEFKGIKIPDTARDWELYDDPGCAKAARELTAALKRSLRHFEKHMGESGQGIAKDLALAAAIPDGINATMAKFSEFGAYDTEPRCHRDQALIDMAKLKVFGTTAGYHPEFGDWL